jgi:glycosyltransferase involved in cell wall biosynthesis
MRVLVHDYSGHPFQAELSRALARRGHEILHVHCRSYQTGKGALETNDDDAEGLRFHGIELAENFQRYSPARRLRQELDYGRRFNRVAASFRPGVILSSNDPLFAKSWMAAGCRRTRTPWVFWLQDIYSAAMARYAEKRLGWAGSVAGAGFRALEHRLLSAASAVVMITEDFRPTLRQWGIPDDQCHVIENWAPLDELPTKPKVNSWARENGLHGTRVLLYSGTLGLKHDPAPLLELALRYAAEEDVRVVVVSEGRGADWLREQRQARGVDNLVLLPYQPYDRLPEVFASADVLLALLSSQAGAFSVPSKILSYLCAGRPILAILPRANLAVRTIERAKAGIVVPPGDLEGFLAGAERLLSDGQLRQRIGANARAYAEIQFDIDSIATRFESILAASLDRTNSTGHTPTRTRSTS